MQKAKIQCKNQKMDSASSAEWQTWGCLHVVARFLDSVRLWRTSFEMTDKCCIVQTLPNNKDGGASIDKSKIKMKNAKIQCKNQKWIPHPPTTTFEDRQVRNDNVRLISCCGQISPLRPPTADFGRNDKIWDCRVASLLAMTSLNHPQATLVAATQRKWFLRPCSGQVMMNDYWLIFWDSSLHFVALRMTWMNIEYSFDCAQDKLINNGGASPNPNAARNFEWWSENMVAQGAKRFV